MVVKDAIAIYTPLSFLADFVFEPIRFEPTSSTLPLSLQIFDDNVPEPRESFIITIASVEIADGRQGMQPQFSGSAEIEIYDNDCKY